MLTHPLQKNGNRDVIITKTLSRCGTIYGSTDELGFSITEIPVHVHDLNATILQLLGFDHTKLTFRHQGRNYRLTDVHGDVVRDILL